jgi:glycerophosphoryl diester phosphodiesterase
MEEAGARVRGGISRRTLIGGAIGVGVAALAGGTAFVAPAVIDAGKPHGRMADQLLGSGVFSVAHRGGSADWPEMSMAAYRNSVGLGVDGLEISLARSSDGVWFGLHDATLDRTSGTKGFIAAEHTWREIQAHSISARKTRDPHQPAQPYVRFEELVDAYGETHAIFVDPKVVPGIHFPELFGLMRAVRQPKRSFVAKGYCKSKHWAVAASAQGYLTWGYYYGAEIEADAKLLSATEGLWTWLGLDHQAPAATWKKTQDFGKPVLAHIIGSKAQADSVRANGAAGLVISAVREVLS